MERRLISRHLSGLPPSSGKCLIHTRTSRNGRRARRETALLPRQTPHKAIRKLCAAPRHVRRKTGMTSSGYAGFPHCGMHLSLRRTPLQVAMYHIRAKGTIPTEGILPRLSPGSITTSKSVPSRLRETRSFHCRRTEAARISACPGIGSPRFSFFSGNRALSRRAAPVPGLSHPIWDWQSGDFHGHLTKNAVKREPHFVTPTRE